MEKIVNEFKLNGFLYRLVKRTDKVCLLHQLKDFGKGLEHVGYEVHVIRIIKAHKGVIAGKTIFFKEKERLASNEDFGTWGWAFQKLKYAEEEYNQRIKIV